MTASTRPIASAYHPRVLAELEAPMPSDGDTPIWNELAASLGDPLVEETEQVEAVAAA